LYIITIQGILVMCRYEAFLPYLPVFQVPLISKEITHHQALASRILRFIEIKML